MTRPVVSRHSLRRRRPWARCLAALACVVAIGAGLVPTPAAGPAPANAQTRTVGNSPLSDILHWADARKACGLTRDALAAMMLTPTYHETGASGANAPSPMTLSRWDNQSTLYAFGAPGFANKAFFHPGIGMWQFDSAGFWPLTAATAINTFTSAEQAASVMATRWCASSQTDPVKRRQYAWGPWYYCTTSLTCENTYQSLLSNGALSVNTAAVSSLGGMELRICEVAGLGTFFCGYVDPARAQGYAAFAIPNFGPSPITAPFYVLEAGGREYRFWLREDTGYAQGVRADKPVTANARTSLTWSYSNALCDRTAGRGSCTAQGWGQPSALGFTTLGAPAMGRNADGRLEVFAISTTGRLWHRFQWSPNGSWSGWYDRGGSLAPGGTPAIGMSPDGRQEVFAVGVNGRLQHIFQVAPNAGWSTWGDRGGSFSVAPLAVGANADGRMEVFGRGTNGALLHTWQLWVNGLWSQPASQGGSIAPGTGPSVGRATDGRQVVAYIGPDGHVRRVAQWWANGNWNAPVAMGGPFPTSAGPVVGTNADGRLEIFALGPFALLVNSWQTSPGGGGFSAFGAIAGYFTTTPSVVRDTTGRQNVLLASFFGGNVTQVRQGVPNGGWGPPGTAAGPAARPVAAGVNVNGRLEVVYADSSGALHTAVQGS